MSGILWFLAAAAAVCGAEFLLARDSHFGTFHRMRAISFCHPVACNLVFGGMRWTPGVLLVTAVFGARGQTPFAFEQINTFTWLRLP